MTEKNDWEEESEKDENFFDDDDVTDIESEEEVFYSQETKEKLGVENIKICPFLE